MMHRVQPQGVTDRDGMTHAALRLVGGHDDDLPQVSDGLHQVTDPRRADAVVYGPTAGWTVCADLGVAL